MFTSNNASSTFVIPSIRTINSSYGSNPWLTSDVQGYRLIWQSIFFKLWIHYSTSCFAIKHSKINESLVNDLTITIYWVFLYTRFFNRLAYVLVVWDTRIRQDTVPSWCSQRHHLWHSVFYLVRVRSLHTRVGSQ
jgi:hypothetical protein